MAQEQKQIYGILAEFESAAALLHAAARIRDAGYKEFDCHSPFPIHGMDEAMGLKRSPLGWIVGLMAFGGLFLAYLLQGWTSTIDYPLIIAGKPFFSYQAYVPVGFGIAVLFGALSAFFGMLVLNKLPQPWHPVFYSNNFEKMSTDGFFISIEKKDEKFTVDHTTTFLASIGGQNIELLQGDRVE
ncbi:DUF3341 domain-containing protein [candidate division KSB1 bacterium]|nr:DUF3341 domain-containing protein [candidate division KSB1 bacterium]RQW00471.1 MAG: DUF3341 domain-containing protein [candidate division KSB1 bacterium]